MLTIKIPDVEYYDEEQSIFFDVKGPTITLEHSLVSISKWEAEWKKPFISLEARSLSESLSYVEHMTITQNINPSFYRHLTQDIFDKISEYIDDPMTATTVKELKNTPKSREVITSEVIYYWMIAFNIPFECQKWHLNRLLTLISVCNIKNTPSKKIPRSEILSNNRALNEARKVNFGTKG